MSSRVLRPLDESTSSPAAFSTNTVVIYNERAFGLGGSCGGCPMGSTYRFHGSRWNVGEGVSLPLELAVSRKEWGVVLFCFVLKTLVILVLNCIEVFNG